MVGGNRNRIEYRMDRACGDTGIRIGSLIRMLRRRAG